MLTINIIRKPIRKIQEHLKGFIVTSNNTKVSVKELLYGRPSKMLVFDQDYIEFCYEVAKCKKELQGDLIKAYSNLLFLKSEKIFVST